MMVRSLVDEVVRRRLWPVPLVALLIAIAAPLLFMKSAPDGAPAASVAPPVAEAGKLPVRASQLLTSSDKAATPRQRSKPKGQDPFAPPASAAKPASGEPKPAAAGGGGGAAPADVKKPSGSPDPAKPAVPKPDPPKPTIPRPVPTTPAKAVTFVDVRFAERMGSNLRRHVKRLHSFKVGKEIVAVFVKYSPKRKKAVFAIAPTTIVTGDVECRRKAGVCRFVDIPVGKHVRLTMVAEDGSLVSRRLDVVRFRRGR